MVLGRQWVACHGRDFVTTPGAAIDSRVRAVGSGIIKLVVGGLVGLDKELVVLILSQGYLSFDGIA
jgi:hypothetical protein